MSERLLDAARQVIRYALEDGVPAKLLRKVVADEAQQIGLETGVRVDRVYRGMKRAA